MLPKNAGTVHVDWPGVCKHFGWSTDVCGPVAMAFDRKSAETHCCYGHAAGCQAHKQQLAEGAPFELKDHREKLNELGLTGVKDELKADAKAKKKPPGTPKMTRGHPIYPARHFG